METSSSPNLGQHPSPSVMGSAGVWVRFRLGDLGGFRPPAHHPRAGVGCKNPFPGSIPLSQRNGRGPAGISAGTARTLPSDLPPASSLPPWQKPGLDLWEQGFLCSIHAQPGSWGKERQGVLPRAGSSDRDTGMCRGSAHPEHPRACRGFGSTIAMAGTCGTIKHPPVSLLCP